MPQPHTGELQDARIPLWTFDAAGNLILAGALYTGGIPNPAGGAALVPPAAPAAQPRGAQVPAVVQLAQASGTVAVNAALGNDFRLTLTASGWTIAAPSGGSDGQDIVFALTQDAAGSRTVTWAAGYDFGTAGAPALTATAAATDLIGFKYFALPAKWYCLGSALGF